MAGPTVPLSISRSATLILLQQQIIDVNLKGVLFTAQAAGRQMRQLKSGGSIVLIASICGHVALEVCRDVIPPANSR